MASHAFAHDASGFPDEAAVRNFESRLQGRLVGRAHDEYETARRVYNGSIDRRPFLIAQCAGANDVVAGVNFARDHGLALAIRGGSHNVAGFGVCDDGLVLDLSPMKGIVIDQAAGRVRVQGGCTWGDVDKATHPVGMAVPGGIISTTGVAGLTLGGGVGHLTRRYGLSCDNLLAAEVVTADGRVVQADARRNEDLFWALRGGGGNFGVVTAFDFRLSPVDTIVGGPILYPIDRTADALRAYNEFMKTAPDELNAFFAILIVPPGPPFPEALHNTKASAVVCCWTGAQEKAEEALRPLREFAPPVFEHVGPMPFPVLQSAFDGLVPRGLHHYWKADFMNDIPAEAIAAHVQHGPGIPTFNSAMHIYPVDGAASRVRPEETAYSHREARFVHVIAAMDPDPSHQEKNTEWVRNYWSALHPHSAGGAYVNFLMEEGDERIAATYRGNYARLSEIKGTWDPENLFCTNQNIPPRRSS